MSLIRKFWVYLLTFTLIYQPTILAQDSNPTVNETMEPLMGDSSKVSLKHKTGSMSATDSAADDHMLWSTVFMFASATTAAFYLVQCPGEWSVRAYAAGAGIYLAQEAMNWSEYDRGSNRELDFYMNEEKKDQKDSIAAARNQTDKAKSAAEDKQDAIELTGHAYTLATSIAIAEGFMADSWATPCVTKNKSPLDQSLQYFAFTKPNQSFYEFIENQRILENKTSSITLEEYKQYEDYSKQTQSEFNFDISQFFNLISSAHASMTDKDMEIYGLIGGAALGMYATTKSAGIAKSSFLYSPGGRATLFGASALIAYQTASSVGDVVNEYGKRVSDYDELLGVMDRAYANAERRGPVKVLARQKLEGVALRPINISPSRIPSQCLNGTVSEVSLEKCGDNKFENPTPQNIQFDGIDTTELNSALGFTRDALDSISSGNLEGMNVAGSSLAQMAARIGDIKDKLEDEVNKKLVSQGQAPRDFKSERKKATNDFKDSVRRAVAQLNPSQQAQVKAAAAKSLPTLGPGGKSAGGNGTKIAAVGSTGTGKGLDPNSKKKKFNFNFKSKENKISHTSTSVRSENALAGYKLNKAEVNRQAGKDIFEIISGRYFKSAYPVFFEEK